MINLKEAGRFSNYFSTKLMELNGIHNKIAPKLKEKKELHKRSLSLTSQEDETKIIELDGEYDVDLKLVESLIKKILSEKVKLSNAIANAKPLMAINVEGEVYAFDTAIEYAKSLRDISGGFYRVLESMKDSTTEMKGYGKTFNVEGNQVPYEYPVEVSIKLLFDKDEVKKTNKDLKAIANKLSMEVEEASSKKIIDFDTEFDYLSTLEELFEKFK